MFLHIYLSIYIYIYIFFLLLFLLLLFVYLDSAHQSVNISINLSIYLSTCLSISQVDCDRLFQSDILENSIHCGDQEPPKDIPPGTGGSDILLVQDPLDNRSEILLYRRVWNPTVQKGLRSSWYQILLIPGVRSSCTGGSEILLYRRFWYPSVHEGRGDSRWSLPSFTMVVTAEFYPPQRCGRPSRWPAGWTPSPGTSTVWSVHWKLESTLHTTVFIK